MLLTARASLSCATAGWSPIRRIPILAWRSLHRDLDPMASADGKSRTDRTADESGRIRAGPAADSSPSPAADGSGEPRADRTSESSAGARSARSGAGEPAALPDFAAANSAAATADDCRAEAVLRVHAALAQP